VAMQQNFGRVKWKNDIDQLETVWKEMFWQHLPGKGVFVSDLWSKIDFA
jgi:hypothetical protein